MKPMLASDWDESKVRFPCIAQPKIDGVRGLNLTGVLTGRSLKSHKNLHATRVFSHPHFKGFDGEMAAGLWTDQDLCRKTTGALNSIKGEPSLAWHVFDYVTEVTVSLPYKDRYKHLAARVAELHAQCQGLQLHLVPAHYVTTMDQLIALDTKWLDDGFEGTCIRDPDGMYKEGRSTVKEGGLLRIKRFMEEDAEVLEVHEGQANGNEAKTNELGRTERSTHQENMTPNGMVGTLTCRLLKDVFDPQSKALLLATGQIVTVSAGSMDHKDRRHYLENPDEIVLKTIKFRFFPKGAKDRPRFPTFVSIRATSDQS
jgi:DNA ligase-1